jgi:hypothetical protein
MGRLAHAYNLICQRGDSLELSHWITGAGSRLYAMAEWRSLFILVLIFQELGRRGISPFSSGDVRLVEQIDLRPISV